VSLGGLRLLDVFRGSACIPAAPVFDPLSSRLAELTGWSVIKLAGSAAKAAELCLPDGLPLANSSDLAAICRRITRVTDLSLIVDADDGGGTPLSIHRLVRDLESAGVAAIEIEDNAVPASLVPGPERHAQLIDTDRQVANLRAAMAARRAPSTLIIARTSAFDLLPSEEALARARAYANCGVDALMLPGLPADPRSLIETLHAATRLPLCLFGLGPDLIDDALFLDRNCVRIRYVQQAVFGVAVQAMYDCLARLRDDHDVAHLSELRASAELLRAVTGDEELAAWNLQYRVVPQRVPGSDRNRAKDQP
jgi:carboxyvinyl-carboxyphosphonate phosphorylmutase